MDEEELSDSTRSRGWCFTINNYTDADVASMSQVSEHESTAYVIYGYEIAPDTGTPHLQCFAYFPNKASFKAVKEMFPRAHIEVMKGTKKQAIDYCKKDGKYVQIGEPPKQGRRTDLDFIKDKIKKKEVVKMRDIVLEASSYQSVRMAEVILKYHEPKRNWKPYVKWLYGPTGTGKTRTAMEELGEDAYITMDTNRWWEGYDAHENVLIDDMRKSFCPFNILLKILDRNGFRIECKGGSRQLLAKKIYITSCYSPEQMFEHTGEDVQQLIRRIDEIKEVV